MANYNLVANSKFKPFTFEELAKPYTMYKEEYDKVQKDLADLEAEASLLDHLNNPNNQEQYNIYNSYMADLESARDALINQGLGNTKNNLMALRSRYNKQIKPMEIAHKAYQDRMKERRTNQARDNSLIYLNKISMQDFLNGAEPEDFSVSLDALTKNTALQSKAMAENIFSTLVAKGVNPEEALMVATDINSDPNFGIITAMKSDIPNYNSLDRVSKDKINNSIATGLYAGFTELINKETVTAYQRATLKAQEAARRDSRDNAALIRNQNLAMRGYKINEDTGEIEIDSSTPAGKILQNKAEGKPDSSTYEDIGEGGKLVGVTQKEIKEGNVVTTQNIATIQAKDEMGNTITLEAPLIHYKDLPQNVKKFYANQGDNYYYYATDTGEIRFIRKLRKKTVDGGTGASNIVDIEDVHNLTLDDLQ